MIITAIRTVISTYSSLPHPDLGKRQLGELQPAELVVTLLISDLAARSHARKAAMPLLDGVIPILVLVAMELLFSGLDAQGTVFLPADQRRPMVVIDNGKLDQQALKRMRVTIGDLVESLREQNVFDIEQIQYAIAETNGKISVLLKPEYRQPSCGDLNAVPPDTGVSMIVVDDGRGVGVGPFPVRPGPPMAGENTEIPALPDRGCLFDDGRSFQKVYADPQGTISKSPPFRGLKEHTL